MELCTCRVHGRLLPCFWFLNDGENGSCEGGAGYCGSGGSDCFSGGSSIGSGVRRRAPQGKTAVFSNCMGE